MGRATARHSCRVLFGTDMRLYDRLVSDRLLLGLGSFGARLDVTQNRLDRRMGAESATEEEHGNKRAETTV